MAGNPWTAGPWEAKWPSSRSASRTIIARGQHIARVMGSSDATAPHDARLIAAAPEMYAALQETVLQLQYLADKFGETGTGAAVLARVNAALAKATGEG